MSSCSLHRLDSIDDPLLEPVGNLLDLGAAVLGETGELLAVALAENQLLHLAVQPGLAQRAAAQELLVVARAILQQRALGMPGRFSTSLPVSVVTAPSSFAAFSACSATSTP